MSHWVTKPTMNHINRPARPYRQDDADKTVRKRLSERDENFSPTRRENQGASNAAGAENDDLTEAEEMARAYCRRRKMGKFGLGRP